jgi:hypothetical protein
MDTGKKIALWVMLLCSIAYIVLGIISVFGIDLLSPKEVRDYMIYSSIGFVASVAYLLYSRW